MTTRTPGPGSTFADEWLTRREHADHRSRAPGLTAAAGRYLARAAPKRPIERSSERPIVVDLGSGQGSNLRYLAPRLSGPRHWRLLDHDAALLDAIQTDGAHRLGAGDTLETRCFDLADDLMPALNGARLVTASALLDLVSAAWIDRLAATCGAVGAAVLLTLSVDGVLQFSGSKDETDTIVHAALALDQRRDKGLGPALGASAPIHMINALSARGFAVTAMPSPWRLDQADAALTEHLIEGWREAAARQFPDRAAMLTSWAARRSAQIAAGHIELTVGHVDVLGLPGTACFAGTSALSCPRTGVNIRE